MNATTNLPLQNIRILDFTWVLAGPYATRLLADFGAEVIKIQPPMPEEDTPFARAYYQTWNRNKLGITLNLGKPEGIELVRRLVPKCDAVVENFSPRVLENWGLDYPELKKQKADIILLSMSLMGHTGPRRDYAGFGPAVHAFSGLTGLTAFPGGPPQGPGFAYADHAAGLTAALALLGALEYRQRTGDGQYIDLAQTEAMTSLMGEAFLEYGMKGQFPQPAGNASPEMAPHGVYPCRGDDRWCAIAVTGETAWQGFCLATGRPELAEDARFNTLEARLANRAALDAIVKDWTLQRTPEEVTDVLQAAGVAAGTVQSAAELAEDPQLKARGFFVETDGLTTDGVPVRLSRTPAQYLRAAPAPGQDNDYVFRELLGLGDEEIARLREQGVIPG